VPTHSLSDWDLQEILNEIATRPSSELESETLEFKGYSSEQALHNAGDLPEELSALANHQGGVIVVGVKAENAVPFGNWDQQLAGWDDKPDDTAIRERLRGKLRPASVELHVKSRHLRERFYIVIGIAHPQDTLVSTSGGKFYIRDGRSSRPMTPEEVQLAVKSLRTYDWSADAVSCSALEALDPVALEEAHSEFCESRQIGPELDRMKFLEAIGATHHGELLRGGLMFLGKEDAIRTELGNHEYRFLWKTNVGELKINDVWTGCIWNAVKRAKGHFNSCNRIQAFTYKGQQFQAPLLDPIAFHEAYLNALVHRDYASVGMVSVLFTSDRLTVASPGGFYGGVTAENIAVHEPRHRNQTLAKILMTFHMVDRAGAGVLRMGLGSLKYGRSFPRFTETQGTVEVSMEAQYIKPPISVLALNNPETYGIAELLILNMVVDKGVAPIAQVLNGLSKLVGDPWGSAQEAIEKLGGVVELCGAQSGIFVRVTPRYKVFMQVEREFAPSRNSHKHVTLYKYLKRHGEASNANLRALLKHGSSSQTSSFLRHAKYVERAGSGPSARWFLVEPVSLPAQHP